MKLHDLQEIINNLVETHGGEMKAVFRYKFGSGRTSEGSVTKYEVSPPKEPMNGTVRFTIDYARGETVND